MSGPAVFDEPDDGVMELVLSSDPEYAGEGPSVEEVRSARAARRHMLLARFLPGVDAGALFAFAFAVVGLTSSAFVETLALNRQVSQLAAGVPTQQSLDPFAAYRTLTDIKAVGMGVFALAGCAVAVLVLVRWQDGRHTRWSRPVAQTALGLGLLGLIFAVLLFTGIVGGLPSLTDSSILNTSS